MKKIKKHKIIIKLFYGIVIFIFLIIFLFLYISLSLLLFKLWHFLCKKIFFDIRINLDINYCVKSIKSIYQKYLLLTIISLGIPLAIILMFFVANFDIFIPSKYIPYDNIFDVTYYIEKIIENAQTLNSLKLDGNTYLLNLYSNSFNLLILLVIIFGVFLTLLSNVVNNLLKKFMLLKNKNTKMGVEKYEFK